MATALSTLAVRPIIDGPCGLTKAMDPLTAFQETSTEIRVVRERARTPMPFRIQSVSSSDHSVSAKGGA